VVVSSNLNEIDLGTAPVDTSKLVPDDVIVNKLTVESPIT